EGDLIVRSRASEAGDDEVFGQAVDHEKLGHGPFVFVIDHVAMVHEGVVRAGEGVEFCDEADAGILLNVNRVFPALFKALDAVYDAGAAGSGEGSELDIMNVKGMTESGVVGDGPFFDGVEVDGLADERGAEGGVVESEYTVWRCAAGQPDR